MSFAQFKHLAGGSAGYYPVATDEKGKLARRTAEEMRSLIGASPSTHTHTVASLSNLGSNWASLLTSAKPTTLAGYGITDAQPLDADLTAIAALSTQPFGRFLLTQADAAAARTTLGAQAEKTIAEQIMLNATQLIGTTETTIFSCTVPGDAVVNSTSAVEFDVDIYTPYAGDEFRIKFESYVMALITSVAYSSSGIYRVKGFVYGVPGSINGIWAPWTLSGETSGSDSYNDPSPVHNSPWTFSVTAKSVGSSYIALMRASVRRIP